MITKSLKLIVDNTHYDRKDFVFENVEDNITKKKSLFIHGPFTEANRKNRNGRTYGLDLLESEIRRFDEELIQTHRSIGALEHPDSPTLDSNIASHLITEIKQDGNLFVGKAKILSTPQGQIVSALINDGVQLGVSSRALGDVDESTGLVTNLSLVTFDIVSNPSSQQAFVNGILESREFICNFDEKNERVYEELDKSLKKMPNTYDKALVEEYLVQKVMAFMARL